MKQPTLFDLPPADEPRPPDQAARDFAIEPGHDVVLEASAGTGKTRVLVTRYVRLIEAGIDPRNILAITFTRKAAAEMRARVLDELSRRASAGAIPPADWRRLRDRISDIQISTIDAFCFSLLREFPLEADVDPAFEIADETEMARFTAEAMDLTFRAARRLIVADEAVRLLFARVKAPVLREALASLVDRRHIAVPAVATFVRQFVSCESAAEAASRFGDSVRALLGGATYRAPLFDDGPASVGEFRALCRDLEALAAGPLQPGSAQQLRTRLDRHFRTRDGDPRKKLVKPYTKDAFRSPEARRRHEAAVSALAPDVSAALDRFDADVDGLLARGLLHVLVLAVRMYDRLLEEHALLDFAAMLERAVSLLGRQEEFARSRLKLQARYHHVLVDEFQDTSRLQWRLIELLIDAWGEGEGAADAPTSIFVVGDRKQSIYRFRHAEVTLLDEAARKIDALRPGRPVRQAITNSFRSVPELLAFVNALSSALAGEREIPERFTYDARDRFPVPSVGPGARRDGEPVLGIVAEPTMEGCAAAVASEVARVLGEAVVRDRDGAPRPARPEDIAILFRSRAGHQYFEDALEDRGVRTYVYKGLGFFDAPEVQDLQALLRCLARPESDLRAAELLRSRFVRLSDVALARLQPAFSRALIDPTFEPADAGLDALDAALLARARADVARWRVAAGMSPPGEVLDLVLRESAYAAELAGRRLGQARENIKKVRALVRRVENRGYATLGRLAEYFETLRAGDESNAIVEATGAVNLMTIHAAKGLEFPIVFVVNLHVPGRGRHGGVSVIESGPEGAPEVAFGSSPATKLEDARDEEELRRLFYVAMTRARDRLYLAAEVDDKSRLRRRGGSRSLAGLLPASVGDLFGAAAASAGDHVTWTSPEGTFDFHICRPTDAPPSASRGSGAATADSIALAPLAAPRRLAGAATDAAGVEEPAESMTFEDEGPDRGRTRLVGTLVHRLLERRADLRSGAPAIAELVPHLVRPDELVDVGDLEPFAAEVAAAFVALRDHPDVAGLLDRGRAFYEVPFSLRADAPPNGVVRGVVDCLVVETGGAATVLEFKTGARRAAHEAQLAIYVRAMGMLLPGHRISGKIVYA